MAENEIYTSRFLFPKLSTPYSIGPPGSPLAFQEKLMSASCARDNVVSTIGATPMVRLNMIPKMEHFDCKIFAKCENFNPTGSLKDRVAKRMIEDAEADKILKPLISIVEPSSGNLGMSLAMVGNEKDYKSLPVVPHGVSKQKLEMLHAMGARFIRHPSILDSNDIRNFSCPLNVAENTQKMVPDSIILGQYSNTSNPRVHYDVTAEEILEQTYQQGIDMIVCGVETGGTISGIGKKIKERYPKCWIIGVEHETSNLSEPNASPLRKFASRIEDLGCPYRKLSPPILDRSVVDKWYKATDEESFRMTRLLIEKEGLLCGPSGGAVVSCAIKAIRNYQLDTRVDARIVVIINEGLQNSRQHFLENDWMLSRQFFQKSDINKQFWWWDITIGNLSLESPLCCRADLTVKRCLLILRDNPDGMMVVIGKFFGAEFIQGIVTNDLHGYVVNKTIRENEPLSNPNVPFYREFVKVDRTKTLGDLYMLLKKYYFVLLTVSCLNYVGGQLVNSETVMSILTIHTIFKYASEVESHHRKESNWDVNNNVSY